MLLLQNIFIFLLFSNIWRSMQAQNKWFLFNCRRKSLTGKLVIINANIIKIMPLYNIEYTKLWYTRKYHI